MNGGFVQIGSSHAGIGGENSFWPSFTDVMMVITLIFLMATSILVVRNWQLVAELQESVAAERMAAQLIESTSQENATLEERLANAEQSNSILRLRLLKKEEELTEAKLRMNEQDARLATLQMQNIEQGVALEQTRSELDAAKIEITDVTSQYQEMSSQIALLNEQLATLTDTSNQQQETINQLSADKARLAQEIKAYNQQLLTLKGEYETIKSQYEELIKPARSARGKYIAQVYYVQSESGKVIRYREPGDEDFSRLSLAELETRLDKLKAEHGKNLYVKIIIPDNSGLTYNEAWEFMRKLLVKYDYYYQN